MPDISLRLPSTTSLGSDQMWDYKFDPNEAPRQWVSFQPTGGKIVQCTTRQANKTMFTGIYYSNFHHDSVQEMAGVGEQAARGKQTAVFLLALADSQDNYPLIGAVETAAANKKSMQFALVDDQEGLGSSRGLAVQGKSKGYARGSNCFYIRLEVFAYCAGYVQLKIQPNKPPTKGGNLLGGCYDYANASDKTTELSDLRKFLDTTLKAIKPGS